jgi:hypothetical protein
MDPADVNAAATLIRSIDPRPIALVLDQSTGDRSKELEYAKASDILMADPYPIGQTNNVSAVIDATKAVSALAAAATKADGRPRSVVMVPQAFGSLGSSWLRNPTAAEGRVMAYLEVLNGARGLLLYARRAPYVMPTNFQLWGEYRALAMEFAEVGPALLAGNVSMPSLVSAPVATAAFKGVGGAACEAADDRQKDPDHHAASSTAVHVRAFDTPTETVFLVVNVANVSHTMQMRSPLLPKGHGAVVDAPFENRKVGLTEGGVLVDSIDAMGTRAYVHAKVPPPPPPSPSSPPPLLANGGFESATSVGVPDGVYAIPQGDLGASFLVDARVAAAGRHSLRLTTPQAGKGVALLFSTVSKLQPPPGGGVAGTSHQLGISMMLRHAPATKASLRFGLLARGDEDVPCCRPGDAIDSDGDGSFHRIQKHVAVPDGCDISLCQVYFELVSAGTVFVDEVALQWD